MLDNLAVKRDCRGKGIGTALLKELYKELKNIKVSYIQILEDIKAKDTKKFWKDKGFKETKRFIWSEKTI